MRCLDDNTVVELLGRRLPPTRLAEVHAHVDACDACRAVVAVAAGEVTAHEDGPTLETYISPVPGSRPGAPGSHEGAPSIAPGTRVDHYSVIRLLGDGGMGQVYLALDTLLERKVALKMVHPELMAQASAVEWFLAEARTTARLDHPNIVRIHAVGKFEDRPYVALELLTGQTLRERLKSSVLDIEEALRLGRAIARALEVAHGQGVCHRDLKPSNVMLCVDRRICVLDFGLAKVVDRDALEITWVGGQPTPSPEDIAKSSSLAGGTPAYMAPERWRGHATTGAADVWALGVMLFESLAGARPFASVSEDGAGKSTRMLDLAKAIVSDEPVRSLAGHPGVPRRLAEIVASCLEKDPDRRPTATRLLADLEELAAELSMVSLPMGVVLPSVPAAPPRARRSRGWVAAAAFMVAAIVVAVLLPWRRGAQGAGADPIAAGAEPPADLVPALLPPSDPGASPAAPESSAEPTPSGHPSAARPAPSWDPASYR